jgi:ESCRT-II complex subunit VPS22
LEPDTNIEIGGRKMVRSVVKQLDEDQATVLAVTQEEGGRVVEDVLIQKRK